MQTYYTEEIAEKSEISEAAEDMTFEEKRAEIMSYIRRMTLMDDAFMSMVLQDKECIELVHGIILERDDLEVMECTTQYTLANLGNRAARLDVMARDKNGKVYDIEVQNAASEKEIKRIRLYSALLDSHYLDKGDEPRNLPETYIIYIMGSDIYPDNLPIYHIDRTVRETGKTFEDELHIILVNSLIRDDTPLGKLMHDFHDRLGFKWGKDLVHFSYGMVELPEGKMKSREGTVVDADDLMDSMVADASEASADRLAEMPADEAADTCRKIGLGALKYFLLKVDPRKNMLFNPKESIDFNGNTGPFLQYTYARIRSLLRKAGAEPLAEGAPAPGFSGVTPNEKEIALIQRVADMPSVVAEAGRTYSPALIANYCYDLAKLYNQFYHDCPILKEDNQSLRDTRLFLSAVVARTLRDSAALLGIEMPERM